MARRLLLEISGFGIYKQTTMISRRDFIKTGTLLTAGAFLPHTGSSSVLNSLSANDKVNVALVGCKGM